MPVLLAILGAIAAAAFWYYRIRAAGDMAGDLADAANDVRLAARRFGYKRKTNVHPADAVDDARVAAAGIVLAIAAMDQAVGEADTKALTIEAQSKFGIDKAQALEIVTLARWVVEQCGNRDEAVRRLARRVRDLAGAEAAADLSEMVGVRCRARFDAEPGGGAVARLGHAHARGLKSVFTLS